MLYTTGLIKFAILNPIIMKSSGGAVSKNPPANAGDMGLLLGSE